MNSWNNPELVRTILSGLAVLLSLIAFYNSYKFSREAAQRARISTAIAEFNALLAHRKNLLEWASYAQEALCDGHCAMQFGSEDENALRRQLISSSTRLSAAIDRGRWLLPNTDHDQYGRKKESAYSGLRQEALDSLVASYNLLTFQLLTPEEDRSAAIKKIWTYRREFTSAIQDKIEPRVLESDLTKLRTTTLNGPKTTKQK